MPFITDIPTDTDLYNQYITNSLNDKTRCIVPSNNFDNYDYKSRLDDIDAHVKIQATKFKGIISEMLKDKGTNGSV